MQPRNKWTSRVKGCSLEILRVLSPDALVSVQGQNGNKHAVPLGDPDVAQSVVNKMSQRCLVDGPDPGAIRERNDVIFHSNPRGGWDGRVHPQPFSHDVIEVLEGLYLLHIR